MTLCLSPKNLEQQEKRGKQNRNGNLWDTEAIFDKDGHFGRKSVTFGVTKNWTLYACLPKTLPTLLKKKDLIYQKLVGSMNILHKRTSI